MTQDNHETPNGASSEAAGEAHAEPARWGPARIAIGFGQGLALWGLHEAWEHFAWPQHWPALYEPLVLIALFAPLIVIAGLGRIRPRALTIWTVGAGAVLAGLGVHDTLRESFAGEGYRQAVNPLLVVFSAAGLFIAHNLVAAADHDRRPVARYATHFELAWKHAVQLGLSGAFVGVFWALLGLGAALFNLIGIKGFGELLGEPWFYIPATFTALAAAGHLNDVRVGLIRGVRTVVLTLLSWLTPMMALIAAAFLLALPFTGLQPLWDTNAATAILLAAGAALIVLITTIYQAGDETSQPTAVLRWAARVGAVVLVPITGLAAYALSMRIGQYGLTPERIIAAAFVLVAAVHAAGYAFAAVRPGGFMKPLETTNVVGAYTALACLLALFTPLADPARLSVDDQMARLAAGKVTPETFDYQFLRFEGEAYGREALERLKRHASPVVREKATAALAQEQRTYHRGDAAEAAPRALTPADVAVISPGKALPAAFLAQDWTGDGALADCRAGSKDWGLACRAIIDDFDRDGADDVLVLRDYDSGLFQLVEGRWKRTADLEQPCQGWEKALADGTWKIEEPAMRELTLNGRRLQLTPKEQGCPPRDAAAFAVRP